VFANLSLYITYVVGLFHFAVEESVTYTIQGKTLFVWQAIFEMPRLVDAFHLKMSFHSLACLRLKAARKEKVCKVAQDRLQGRFVACAAKGVKREFISLHPLHVP